MLTEWLGVPSFMTKSMLVARKSPAGLRGDIKSVLVVSSRLQVDTDAALVGVDGVGSGSITDDGGLCIDWASSSDFDGGASLTGAGGHALDLRTITEGPIRVEEISRGVNLTIKVV